MRSTRPAQGASWPRVKTVAEVGWAGIKNGELLRLAATQFDVLLTVDRNLEYQQNLAAVALAVIVELDQRLGTTARLWHARSVAEPALVLANSP